MFLFFRDKIKLLLCVLRRYITVAYRIHDQYFKYLYYKLLRYTHILYNITMRNTERMIILLRNNKCEVNFFYNKKNCLDLTKYLFNTIQLLLSYLNKITCGLAFNITKL